MRNWVKRHGRLSVGGAVAILVLASSVVLVASATADPSVTGAQIRSFGLPAGTNLNEGHTITCTAPATSTKCQIRFAFETEQTTSSVTSVDAAPTGSDATYSDASTLPGGSIASGTCIDSWIFHFDAGANGAAVEPTDGSTVTFQAPILGVEALNTSLDNTDSTFGRSSTTYPTGVALRGLELANGSNSNQSGNPDTFTLLADGKTFGVHMDTGASDGDFDQVRVLTACVPTTIPLKTSTGGLALNITPRPIIYDGSAHAETVKATVASSVDNGPITGSVHFYIDGNFVGDGTLKPSSTVPGTSNAKLAISLDGSLQPGYHTLKAVYDGLPPEYGPSSQSVDFLIHETGALG
jgi:hypothetical protein